MLLVEQRDHHINHGETRANQEDRRIGVEIRHDRWMPWIGDVTRGVAFGGKIADRECDRIDIVLPATADLDTITFIRSMQRDGLIGDEIEPMSDLIAPDLARENVLDIT